MAATTEGRIFAALMTRAGGLSALGLPIAWPNVDFTPPENQKYLRVQFVPNVTQRQWIASDGVHRYLGLLQVSVFWPKGQYEGELRPREIAGQVAAHFPCDHQMTEDDVTVRVMERPTVADMLPEDSRVHIPVTIQWECFH
ncbi:DUF4128 domain-containing protein [Pseudophaeobacter sp.]|uniref:DUF4128 domain-containing protein n=1 Tax=Pseudophaeobacter sp. TaxID=1971739 RepID=UPI003A973EC6